jgi:hypothetical protein
MVLLTKFNHCSKRKNNEQRNRENRKAENVERAIISLGESMEQTQTTYLVAGMS